MKWRHVSRVRVSCFLVLLLASAIPRNVKGQRLFGLYRQGQLMRVAEASNGIKEKDVATVHVAAVTETVLDIALSGNALQRFLVPVTVGSPGQEFHLQADIASDLIWTPCDCGNNCSAAPDTLQATEEPFSIARSSSATVLPCVSATCQDRSGADVGCTLPGLNASDPSCQYSLSYYEGSVTSGNLYTDQVGLSLGNGHGTQSVAATLYLGCGEYQLVSSYETRAIAGGVLGLGRGELSLPSQLFAASVISTDSFSLCLEGDPTASIAGLLSLGAAAFPSGVSGASMAMLGSSASSQYWFQPTSMVLGNRALATPSFVFFVNVSKHLGAILDSGTPFTFLQLTVFNSFVSTFRASARFLVNSKYADRPKNLRCYDAPYNLTSAATLAALFPALTLVVDGGASNLTVYPFEYLIQPRPQTVCLTIRSSGRYGDHNPATVIGSAWLRNKYLVFNRAAATISWANLNCTTLSPLDDFTGAAVPPPSPPPPSSPPPSPPPLPQPPPTPPPSPPPPPPLSPSLPVTSSSSQPSTSLASSPKTAFSSPFPPPFPSITLAPSPLFESSPFPIPARDSLPPLLFPSSPNSFSPLPPFISSPSYLPSPPIPIDPILPPLLLSVPDSSYPISSPTVVPASSPMLPLMPPQQPLPDSTTAPPPSPPGCPPSGFECAFGFKGSFGSVPTFTYPLGQQGDYVLGTDLVVNLSGAYYSVPTSNAGKASFVCPPQASTDPDPSSQFYMTQAGLKVRSFGGAMSASAFTDRFISVTVSNAQILVGGQVVNLNSGDGNPLVPEAQRCIFFQMKIAR
eukprot:TRINITY_DN9582_c0_g1_i2.p1 TRINITY_DN9582_c0_g1~~TRINITY_DN9582_c0_g1_i2.p1  ORF type:complete len:799 (+),score=117.48 TRINITY_DN9582_c0_g1_i2:272-2668(+)